MAGPAAAAVAPANLMRIVMVGPFGLHRKGTMRARALPLARALVERGHRVTVLIPPWDSPQDAGRRWFDAGVEVINISLPPPIPMLDHAAITRRLAEYVLRLHPDVVHAFKPKAYAGLTAAALWWLRRLGQTDIRLVMDTDDWEGAGGWNEIEPYTPAQRRLFAWQERWGLTHCDAVTVASRVLQTLVWGMGVERGRVFYVPNGVEASAVRDKPAVEQSTGEARKVLLYTRFVEFEVERLLAIWQRVVQQAPDAKLVVAGQGLRGEEQVLLRLAGKVDKRGQIVYLGWPGQAVLPGLFAACDLAILPFDDTLVNRTKCSARLVELMAAGLPVVAEAVGQNREYIETDVSGMLAPPGDVEAFATAIITLLEDPNHRQQLADAARHRIAGHFTWQHLVAGVEQAYGVAMG